MMTVRTFCVNPLQENCYVVSDETGQCAVIDCGAWYDQEHKAISDYIARNNLVPVHLLCTHGHFDHVIGCSAMSESYGLKPEVHRGDEFLITGLEGQLRQMMGLTLTVDQPKVEHWLHDGERVSVGNHVLQVMHTPGHTPGGVVFWCKEDNLLFSGDTLFRMSVGRTDFEGGSWQQLLHSLSDVIAPLPDTTKVYTGHGPATTVGEEKTFNPYMRTE